MGLTSRERVEAALKHEEVDRIPIDFGGSRVTGIASIAYKKLADHLGISEDIHLYDNSRIKATLAILKNIYYLISKQFSSKVNFIDRIPRLENFRGPDDDAVYWSGYTDLVIWFKKNGYKVKRASFNPRKKSWINKIKDKLWNIMPVIDKGICMVVTKNNKMLWNLLL